MSDAGINPDTRPYQPVVLPREAISNIAVQTELTRPLSPQTIRMGSSEGKGNSTRLEEMPEANLRGEIIGNPLSQRQVEILFLAGKGLSNERIANELGVSKHTVKNIISETLSKMGVVTAIDAISKGIELGVFPPEELEEGFDVAKLGQLTASERRTYLAIVSSGEDVGFKELAHSVGISYQRFKADASGVWSKLGITRRRAKIFNNFAEREKREAMQKDIDVSEGIDIFDGIPLPQEVRKISQGEDRKKLINQALSLFAYGITDFEASRAMGISHNVYSNLMSKARSMYEASNSADAVVRAMQEGKIRAEEVIPEGYILKLDGLRFQEREIYDEIINNPGATYELIGAKFNLAPSLMKFRAMQVFKKLGVSSRNHMVIVDNALKIKEAVNSSEDNLNIEVA